MGKKKILIADDVLDTVELIRKRLRHEGYDTAEAYDGEECVKRARDYNPDLIILDILMPKMDGFEVCKTLKSDPKTRYIPIIMLTARGDTESKVKGFEIGADDYVAKPFDFKELLARVKSLIARKEQRDRLAEEKKSEALDKMMEQLAHEIRNPLVSIGGFAKRVHNSLPEGDKNKLYLETIVRDAARLERMLEKLVELRRTDITYLEPVNLNEVIEEVLEDFKPEIEDKNVDVSTDLMEDPPLLSADRQQIKIAIANLVKNALEALGKGERRVHIRTSSTDRGVEVQISDTGKGISRDDIERIFDPFFTTKVYGPGLGLTLALKIIHAHRGTVTVESKPGQGTSFTVRLPLRQP